MPEFCMMFARKINQMPEFYVTFAGKNCEKCSMKGLVNVLRLYVVIMLSSVGCK